MIHVTITGIDDTVGTVSVGRMADHFPWVEWGVLISASRTGKPRYPSARWLGELDTSRINVAAHLCGSITTNPRAAALLVSLGHFRRVQVNGYVAGSAQEWREALGGVRTKLVLQVRDEQLLSVVEAEAYGIGADVLFDPSGGLGRRPPRWPARAEFVRAGFAGGINPDNVEEIVTEIRRAARDPSRDIWIDMETGVRTEDDRLDWNRVADVLHRVQKLNEAAR